MENFARFGRWIAIFGGVIFIVVLFISAYWEPDIRWLHFFQSWLYLVSIILIWKHSKWGYFAGAATAVLWDYTNLFVTTFLKSGLTQVKIFAHTGHISRPDLFVAVPGWIGNLAVVIGCILAYSVGRNKRGSDFFKFAATAVFTTGFFAIDMAISQPRYLGIFPALLHPHLHI